MGLDEHVDVVEELRFLVNVVMTVVAGVGHRQPRKVAFIERFVVEDVKVEAVVLVVVSKKLVLPRLWLHGVVVHQVYDNVVDDVVQVVDPTRLIVVVHQVRKL